jgi:DNA-binding CsgD family transcriptional regulator
MAKSAAVRAEARFKQLCCLGLDGEAVMPALMKELRALIPFYCAHFHFLDLNGTLTRTYLENPETANITPLYLREFFGRADREMAGTFPNYIRTQIGVCGLEDTLRVDMDTFHRSDQYNLIWRVLHYHTQLRLVVREGGNGRALGSANIFRSAGEAPFSVSERRRFAELEGFLAHALHHHSEAGAEVALSESGETGLIIADSTGRPVHFSSAGRRLLFLAQFPRAVADSEFQRLNTLPSPVTRICRDLGRIFSDNPAAVPPTYRVRNVWGGFTFRAQWLKGDAPSSGQIGITVSRQEPVSVMLTRRIGEMPLSRRQAEVCFLMASGASNERIAEQLSISRHTAIAHGRWIYNKLNVENRAELVKKLLAA